MDIQKRIFLGRGKLISNHCLLVTIIKFLDNLYDDDTEKRILLNIRHNFYEFEYAKYNFDSV